MDCTFIATASFGLEGVVKRELEGLNISAKAELGCARFTGSILDAFRALLWLRTADRVLLVVGEREARSFEELFTFVKALPWHQYMPKDAAFPVSGKCARSQLMSVRDCQAITKKAIAEAMKAHYKTNWCAETGAEYKVDVSLHGDVARLTLDLTGTALNRRGYRTWNGEAPLRETLAAALVILSPWRLGQPLYDPCCGTGTLLIEAAMIQSSRAPGLSRAFACESWPILSRADADKLRGEARAKYRPERIQGIMGSDIDEEALTLARRHIEQAGFAGKITVRQADLRSLQVDAAAPVFIANPPYGERLSDKKSCEALYRDMRGMVARHPGARLCVITSNPAFERFYGVRAKQKRRLYNGRLECEYLVY